jgi:hypothetical protein
VDELVSEAGRIVQTLDSAEKLISDPGLSSIENEYLSSVEFVMDYVQLYFCGPTLTAYAELDTREGDFSFKASDPGYRDALCRRIGINCSRGPRA